MTVKLEWIEIEKLPNGIRYRKFINGKPTDNYKLELSAGDPTLDLQVGASADDCDRYGSAIDLTATYFYVDYSSTNQCDAARFTTVAIPQGATIDVAYAILRARATVTPTGGCDIKGQDSDNTITFSTVADFDARPRTTASVSWSPSAWVTDIDYNSPSIVSVIQEIVNRAGWVSGNSLVLFFVGKQIQSIRGFSYDSSATYAPKLHIEYSTPPPPSGRSFGYIIG